MAPSERLGSCPTRVCCPSKINCQLLGKKASTFHLSSGGLPPQGPVLQCLAGLKSANDVLSVASLTVVLFGLARSSQGDIDKHLRVLRLLAPRHCSVHFASLRAESDRHHGVLEATRQGPLNAVALHIWRVAQALFASLCCGLSFCFFFFSQLHPPLAGRAAATPQAGCGLSLFQ